MSTDTYSKAQNQKFNRIFLIHVHMHVCMYVHLLYLKFSQFSIKANNINTIYIIISYGNFHTCMCVFTYNIVASFIEMETRFFQFRFHIIRQLSRIVWYWLWTSQCCLVESLCLWIKYKLFVPIYANFFSHTSHTAITKLNAFRNNKYV